MIDDPVTEADLQGYVDDALPAARRSVVAAMLDVEPGLAARVAAYAQDRDRLRKALAAVPLQALPAAWSRQIATATGQGAPERRMPMAGRMPSMSRRMAIAASVAFVIGVGGITAMLRPGARDIVAEAQAGRADRLASAETIAPGALQDARERDGRMQAVLGLPVKAPDLHRFGFTLAGLDLYSRAAQLRYVDRNGRMLTIYVRPSDGKVRFDIVRQGSTRICIWQDDIVGAVIMAPMDAGEMMRVASAAYTALNL